MNSKAEKILEILRVGSQAVTESMAVDDEFIPIAMGAFEEKIALLMPMQFAQTLMEDGSQAAMELLADATRQHELEAVGVVMPGWSIKRTFAEVMKEGAQRPAEAPDKEEVLVVMVMAADERRDIIYRIVREDEGVSLEEELDTELGVEDLHLPEYADKSQVVMEALIANAANTNEQKEI